MIYLALAILISAAFNIGLTWAKKCGCEEKHVTWFNYLMASIGGIYMMIYPYNSDKQRYIFDSYDNSNNSIKLYIDNPLHNTCIFS